MYSMFSVFSRSATWEVQRMLHAWLPASCAVLVVAISVVGVSGNGMEQGNVQWKPIIGKWYDWRDSSGHDWQAIDIAVNGKKAKVTFLCRRAPSETTEHFRGILFSEDDNKELRPLPYSVGGKQKLDMYWYEAAADTGPFLRLLDWQGEYVVDIAERSTAMLVRVKKRVFIGKFQKGDDDMAIASWSVFGNDNQPQVSVAGRDAKEITGPIASDTGKPIGKIAE